MTKTPMTKALNKLSRRAYSKYELEKSLLSSGFAKEEVEQVITRLCEWGYINDKKMAEDLFSYYLRIKYFGPLMIRKKMLQKGIPESYIAEILLEYDEDKQTEMARELAKKYLNKKKIADKEALKYSLARYLLRKGFLQNNILKVISQVFTELDSTYNKD